MSAMILESVAPAATSTTALSTRSIRVGRILTGVAVLFLLFDITIKLTVSPEAVKGTADLGWPVHHMVTLAVIQVACLILYLVPRTAPLGAVLWTGYLGGAIATHLRIDNPLFSHTLFPVYVAAFIWGGLYLRDERVRALLRWPR